MSSYWPIKKRRRRRTDWDQIHRLATVGGRTLRELSDEYHIPYGTLCNRAWRERWMIARIHSNSRAAAQARTSASQEQYNQLASQAALDTQNGSQATRTPNSPPSQATGSSGAIMTPETIASSLDPESVRLSLLASINYFARLALQTTGKPLAYNLSHDDWTTVSRVVSQLSVDRSHFGGTHPASRLQSVTTRYTQTSSWGH